MKNTKTILIILIIFLNAEYSFSQIPKSIEKKYHEQIEYRKIPNKKLFETLTSAEIEKQEESLEKTKKAISQLHDSIIKMYGLEKIKEFNEKAEYKNNRSRIYFDNYLKKISKKEYINKGLNLPCNCLIKKDTLTIATGFGFFGGAGLASQIYKENFKNYFWEYSDHEYLKFEKEDTILKKSIEIDAKYQKLILESKPTPGEILTGYFSILTKPYYTYERKKNSFGEVYFKCLVSVLLDEEDK